PEGRAARQDLGGTPGPQRGVAGALRCEGRKRASPARASAPTGDVGDQDEANAEIWSLGGSPVRLVAPAADQLRLVWRRGRPLFRPGKYDPPLLSGRVGACGCW